MAKFAGKISMAEIRAWVNEHFLPKGDDAIMTDAEIDALWGIGLSVGKIKNNIIEIGGVVKNNILSISGVIKNNIL